MNLLIITQKVDKNDDVLGFFHRWIEEFAKHCEQVTVICLQKGEFDLPKNVRVFSLGKENGVSRLTYVLRFYKYIWNERKNYDSVFVHMNQEYVLMGGVVWRIFGKKVSMWRNHYDGSFLTRMAMTLSNNIFCTSAYSFTAQSKKTTIMPVGIDTNLFKNESHVARKHNSVLFLARMSPTKNPDLIIEALKHIHEIHVPCVADFYGNPLPQDEPYLDGLKEKVSTYKLGSAVSFKKGIPNTETPKVYNTHEIFINASPSGMYDKTIFEAMACESLILTSNLNLKGQIDDIFLFKENDGKDLAKQLKYLLGLDIQTKEKCGKILRTYVVEHHSLEMLIQKLIKKL